MYIILFFLILTGCTSNSNPQAADINAELGMMYLKQGKLELAEQKILKAFQQNPYSYKTNLALGQCFDRLGEAKLAKKYYLQAEKYNSQKSFKQMLEN